MQIIDGKKIRDEILVSIKKEISSLSFQPIFCDILVGDDPSSIQYIKMKSKIAESLGIKFHNANFPASITTEDLIKEIKILNNIPNMCGIIVQLPLPATLDRRAVLDAIDLKLDVDCLGTIANEKFYNAQNEIGLPTACACLKILDFIRIPLENKKIIVLGKGDLVGRPTHALLKFRNLDVNIVSSQTENKEEIVKNADIIISGIGKGKYITKDMVKQGVILIDAGTSEENGSIVGDIDFDSVKNVASFISPVPGGVGPVTVAMLFNNVLKVAKQLQKRYE